MLTETITIYRCEHCGKSYKKKSTAEKHEQSCTKNPNRSPSYKDRYLKDLLPLDVPRELHQYMEIAKSFYALFEQNLKDARAETTNLEKAKGTWIDDVRLLMEKDGYSIDILRDVFQFLKEDHFWKQNILSMSKLRQQIDKLLLKINSNGKTSKIGATNHELAKMLSKKFAKDS